MLKLKNDGFVYISESGIEYELLEGMSIGTEERYTSDIIFILLMDCDYNVDNNVVGWLFGSSSMLSDDSGLKDYEELIKKMVEEFENRNFKQNSK